MRLAGERAVAPREGITIQTKKKNKGIPLSLLSPLATHPHATELALLTLPGDLLLFLKTLPNFAVSEGLLPGQHNPFLFMLPEHLKPIFTVEVQLLMLLIWVCRQVFLPHETENSSKALTALIVFVLLY